MSTKLVEVEIDRFLRSAEPEILCISGPWGTGKTHTWKASVASLSDAGNIALQSYSYCSLFGINSVSDLKQAIWENTIPSNKKVAPANVLVEKLRLLEEKRKAISTTASAIVRDVTQKFGGSNVANLLVQSSFWFVRNQIVVIDDIERKGKDLTIAAVLGLLSDLREQRQCKVVLILNDEQLDEVATYRKYTEKVIDRYLAFKPLPLECVEKATLAFDGVKLVRDDCIALGLTNIRVIVRVAKIVEQVAQRMDQADERVRRHSFKMVVVLGWMTLSPDAPPLDFLEGRTQRRVLRQINRSKENSNDSETHQETVWHAKLDKVGVPTISEFDVGILDGIRDGFFNPETLDSLVSRFEASLRTSDNERAFNSAWDMFHLGFVDNEVEIIKVLESSIRAGASMLGLGNMDASIDLLRDLGCAELAEELINHYVENRADINKDLHDAQQPLTRVKDERLLEAIKQRAKSQMRVAPSTIGEIIAQLGAHPETDPGLAVLERASAGEVATALKALRGVVLRSALEVLSSPQRPLLRKILGQSLEQIASESNANRVRVENWIKGGSDALLSDSPDRAGPTIEHLEKYLGYTEDETLAEVMESVVEFLGRGENFILKEPAPSRLINVVEGINTRLDLLRSNHTEWAKITEWARKKQLQIPHPSSGE